MGFDGKVSRGGSVQGKSGKMFEGSALGKFLGNIEGNRLGKTRENVRECSRWGMSEVGMSEVRNVRGGEYPKWRISGECPRWGMSEVGNDRGEECPSWRMSEVGNVRGGECLCLTDTQTHTKTAFDRLYY